MEGPLYHPPTVKIFVDIVISFPITHPSLTVEEIQNIFQSSSSRTNTNLFFFFWAPPGGDKNIRLRFETQKKRKNSKNNQHGAIKFRGVAKRCKERVHMPAKTQNKVLSLNLRTGREQNEKRHWTKGNS